MRVLFFSKLTNKWGVMKKQLFPLLLLIIGITSGGAARSQEDQLAKRNAEIEACNTLFYSNEYEFVAETMQPSGYFNRRMDAGYKIIVSKDSIICNLPYMGRAYAAPIGQTDNGIKFISTKFTYTYKNRNKSGWIATIKPQDNNDVRTITLTILDNRSTYVTIISNNRQPISFSGEIIERGSR